MDTIPREEETLFRAYSICPRSETLLAEWEKTDDAKKLKNEHLADWQLVEQFTETELTWRRFPDIMQAIDVDRNLTEHPDEARNNLYEARKRMIELDWISVKKRLDYTDPEFQNSTCGHIYEEWFSTNLNKTLTYWGLSSSSSFHSLNSEEDDQPSVMFYEYSAHDSTLIATLGTFGFPLTEIPYYGSALIIELHSRDNEGDANEKYYYNFYFQPAEKDAETDIFKPFTPKQCDKQNCGATYIRDKLSITFPSKYGEAKWWTDVCKTEKPYYIPSDPKTEAKKDNEKSKQTTFTILLAVFGTFFLISIVCLIIVLCKPTLFAKKGGEQGKKTTEYYQA